MAPSSLEGERGRDGRHGPGWRAWQGDERSGRCDRPCLDSSCWVAFCHAVFPSFLPGARCAEGGRSTERRAPSLTLGWGCTMVIRFHDGPRAEPTDEEGRYITRCDPPPPRHSPTRPPSSTPSGIHAVLHASHAAGQEQGDGARVRARLGKMRATIGTWVSANVARVRRIRLTRQQAVACVAAASVGLAALLQLFLRCSRHDPPPASYSWRNRRCVCVRARARACVPSFVSVPWTCAPVRARERVAARGGGGGSKVGRIGCLCVCGRGEG